MRRFIVATLLIIGLYVQTFAHSGKPKYHVIIDTDGAIDDMRAITMLLAGNDIRVLAINSSQGTLKADSVYVKIKSLLSSFHHEGIRVGLSSGVDFKLPVWSSFAQNIVWGNIIDQQDIDFSPNSLEVLNQSTENYKGKITLIALGSLKTYADWFRSSPEIINKIDRIIWYNSHKVKNGFNYRISPEGFDFIKKSGVPLEIVANNSTNLVVTPDYLKEIGKEWSFYAAQINLVHKQTAVVEKIKQKHLQLWDDIVPLYLTVPVLFEMKAEDQIKYVALSKVMPAEIVYETIGKLLASSTQTNNRVFTSFPIDTALYKPQYVEIVSSTIEKFGLIEWKAIAMTNEIHGHTGIYSIIGAKAGIRAMEYFNVGVNNMKVITFAGRKPPLSCFNDGVQISTGATIGQGLITVADSVSGIPSAIFEFNKQRVHLSIKKEIAQQMRKEIKHGIKTYGLLTDEYWRYIETLAIEYWSDFNRYRIFDIEEVN